MEENEIVEEQEKVLVVHENIHRLKVGDKNVALIGTAHVSQESADLVKEIIDKEKPDSVCIELCENRYKSIKERDNWRNMDLVKVIKEKKALILIINFMLSSFQRKMAKKLGVRPGQEMIQAIESSDEHGLNVEVIDRDVRTTLNRTWGYMGLKSKMNLLIGMVGWGTILGFVIITAAMLAKLFVEGYTPKMFGITMAAAFGVMMFAGGNKSNEEDELTKDKLEDMKKQDTLELLLAEMGESVPDIKKRLIDERDLYMVEKIRHAPGKDVIAVVGAGHVPGMIKNWETEINISELDEAPKPGYMGKVIKWGIPAVIVAIFALGFVFGGADKFKDLVWIWVVVNGACSAIGTMIALGHPLSIIVAFIAAPITSMNPAIGAGMVVGFVEALLRKPKVEDFEQLPEDFVTARGWWRNKVTRVLLVFLLSGFGSAVGTWIAGFMMAEKVAQ
ncbi:MAG: TraB/GumN family protein [Lentisphaeraceae bacterium]|nr:TraB/GumN family protein [Lentisphaeraceae bacterium]